jgi:hypothetical protein
VGLVRGAGAARVAFSSFENLRTNVENQESCRWWAAKLAELFFRELPKKKERKK